MASRDNLLGSAEPTTAPALGQSTSATDQQLVKDAPDEKIDLLRKLSDHHDEIKKLKANAVASQDAHQAEVKRKATIEEKLSICQTQLTSLRETINVNKSIKSNFQNATPALQVHAVSLETARQAQTERAIIAEVALKTRDKELENMKNELEKLKRELAQVKLQRDENGAKLAIANEAIAKFEVEDSAREAKRRKKEEDREAEFGSSLDAFEDVMSGGGSGIDAAAAFLKGFKRGG